MRLIDADKLLDLIKDQKEKETGAEDTRQIKKRCVYIQHSLEIWYGAGKQRTD